MGQLKRYHIDYPTTDCIRSPQTTFVGWAAVDRDDPIVSAVLYVGAHAQHLRLVERPDVVRAFPDLAAVGFETSISLDRVGDVAGDNWNLQLEVIFSGSAVRVALPLVVDALAAATYITAKARKLALVRPVLQCPHCGSRTLEDRPETLSCIECNAMYGRSARAFDFLSAELKLLGAADTTENISANSYDAEAYAIIERYRDGLVLDAGSGMRGEYLPNVVNFEIVGYASTDVVGVCERLPFRDDTFDAVFSFAVLEHVRDPFTAARELVRVLKPDGVLYAAVPFLQPYHGFPHHYYNMTSRGLLNLFSDLHVETLDVPHYGLPIWALTWMLKSWVRALPPDVAQGLCDRKVGELMGDPVAYMNEAFVTGLPAGVNEELACVNRLIARKPVGRAANSGRSCGS